MRRSNIQSTVPATPADKVKALRKRINGYRWRVFFRSFFRGAIINPHVVQLENYLKKDPSLLSYENFKNFIGVDNVAAMENSLGSNTRGARILKAFQAMFPATGLASTQLHSSDSGSQDTQVDEAVLVAPAPAAATAPAVGAVSAAVPAAQVPQQIAPAAASTPAPATPVPAAPTFIPVPVPPPAPTPATSVPPAVAIALAAPSAQAPILSLAAPGAAEAAAAARAGNWVHRAAQAPVLSHARVSQQAATANAGAGGSPTAVSSDDPLIVGIPPAVANAGTSGALGAGGVPAAAALGLRVADTTTRESRSALVNMIHDNIGIIINDYVHVLNLNSPEAIAPLIARITGNTAMPDFPIILDAELGTVVTARNQLVDSIVKSVAAINTLYASRQLYEKSPKNTTIIAKMGESVITSGKCIDKLALDYRDYLQKLEKTSVMASMVAIKKLAEEVIQSAYYIAAPEGKPTRTWLGFASAVGRSTLKAAEIMIETPQGQAVVGEAIKATAKAAGAKFEERRGPFGPR